MKIVYKCDKEKKIKEEKCNGNGCVRYKECNHTTKREYSLNWKEKEPEPKELLTLFEIRSDWDWGDDVVFIEK